jgi:uncharacterized protein YkwD
MSTLNKLNSILALFALLFLASCGDQMSPNSPQSQVSSTSQNNESRAPTSTPETNDTPSEELDTTEDIESPSQSEENSEDSQDNSNNQPESPEAPEEEPDPVNEDDSANNAADDCAAPDRAVACEVMELINNERRQRGLAELKESKACRDLAEAHSLDMAMDNFFSHTSPTYGSFSTRAQLFGLPGAKAENIFMASRPSASLAVQTWMGSTGHRNNILNPRYSNTGVGVSFGNNRYYFTQCFHQ